VRIKWDREADAAYISLSPDQDRVHGVTTGSVTLQPVAEETGLAAALARARLDRDGKLIGIEVLAPRDTLRESTLLDPD
jgi:uncharacterized protein YuzE